MPQFVAFLRAVNVGGRFVRMEDLRKMFADLGFAQVETFIQSGNVFFSSPDEDAPGLEKRIEAHLAQALGYAVMTFLRTPGELAAIAGYAPFPSPLAATDTLYVSFLKEHPISEAQQKMLALANPVDEFHFHGRELYWLRHSALGESVFTNAILEKLLRAPATNRNITTVKKMAAKRSSGGG
ncbi:MAG TPA: DUF1697 domain-containing protein [Anaerolineaceae bacterium]|nr:DUF1697 domain-containing protein [Anaerolineaceae bacterium]